MRVRAHSIYACAHFFSGFRLRRTPLYENREPLRRREGTVRVLTVNMASDQAVVLKQKAKEAIDNCSSELFDLNKSIWENPELCFKETHAHDQLTEFLAERGFDVTPHYTLDTAFRAESGEDGGLTIGLISEYDALPEVGHACGHNLIAESGVAAALGKHK